MKVAAVVGVLAALATSPPPPLALLDEIDRMAARDLWPGFDPRRIPLAIFDGDVTWLLRHPHPPPEFEAWAGDGRVRVVPGRHDALRANNWAEIGGGATATALLDGTRPLARRAGTAIHEAFHVFQSQRHPNWGANELDLFLYPVEDPELLALRRLESAALREALRAPEAAPWAKTALQLRRERFARLPAEGVAYERGVELKEGLAQYVEDRATGSLPAERLPAAEFPAEDVRQRAYASGEALGALLDRFDGSWRAKLESGEDQGPEQLLASALEAVPGPPQAFPEEERARALATARTDVAALLARRTERARAFRAKSGQVLRVVTEGPPFWPQGFDPWNLLHVAPAEILHTRFLRLGNSSGHIEVLDRESLTEGVGRHPLLNGIRAVTVTGLPREPTLTQEGDLVHISGPGVSGELRGATIERNGTSVTVRVPAPR